MIYGLEELRGMIEKHPDRGSLPVACVLAFCQAESSFRPYAIKWEPQYKWLVGDQRTMSRPERFGQMHSWGLMRVMGGVAREHGFDGPFTELWDPMIGLRYGMKHLRKYWARYENWPDTIAAYNAGSPRRVDGKYVNQVYVDKVLRWWNDYEQQVPLKETEV